MSKYLFRYAFSAGKEMHYSIAINGKIDVLTPGGNISNPVKITMNISQTVVSCEEHDAIIKVRIDKVTADSKIPQESLPKIGVDSLMHIDSLGKVRWVDGAAAWQGAEHSMMRFPEEELEIGDSWVQQVEDASGSATPFYTRYRFNGRDRRNKQLAVFATEMFSGHPDNPASQSAGKGSFTFSLEEHWIHDSSNQIKYAYQIPVPENPSMSIETRTVLNIDMEKL